VRVCTRVEPGDALCNLVPLSEVWAVYIRKVLLRGFLVIFLAAPMAASSSVSCSGFKKSEGTGRYAALGAPASP
jgi:hypothetical protein